MSTLWAQVGGPLQQLCRTFIERWHISGLDFPADGPWYKAAFPDKIEIWEFDEFEGHSYSGYLLFRTPELGDDVQNLRNLFDFDPDPPPQDKLFTWHIAHIILGMVGSFVKAHDPVANTDPNVEGGKFNFWTVPEICAHAGLPHPSLSRACRRIRHQTIVDQDMDGNTVPEGGYAQRYQSIGFGPNWRPSEVQQFVGGTWITAPAGVVADLLDSDYDPPYHAVPGPPRQGDFVTARLINELLAIMTHMHTVQAAGPWWWVNSMGTTSTRTSVQVIRNMAAAPMATISQMQGWAETAMSFSGFGGDNPQTGYHRTWDNSSSAPAALYTTRSVRQVRLLSDPSAASGQRVNIDRLTPSGTIRLLALGNTPRISPYQLNAVCTLYGRSDPLVVSTADYVFHPAGTSHTDPGVFGGQLIPISPTFAWNVGQEPEPFSPSVSAGHPPWPTNTATPSHHHRGLHTQTNTNGVVLMSFEGSLTTP